LIDIFLDFSFSIEIVVIIGWVASIFVPVALGGSGLRRY